MPSSSSDRSDESDPKRVDRVPIDRSYLSLSVGHPRLTSSQIGEMVGGIHLLGRDKGDPFGPKKVRSRSLVRSTLILSDTESLDESLTEVLSRFPRLATACEEEPELVVDCIVALRTLPSAWPGLALNPASIARLATVRSAIAFDPEVGLSRIQIS